VIREEAMPSLALEKLDVFKAAEVLADAVWPTVKHWDALARDTIGKQLVGSADSVGANIAEGYGLGSFQDDRRFIRIARGSYMKRDTGSDEHIVEVY